MAEINKCPYCYRILGSWSKDPILLPDGSKYKWEDETTLIEETELENRLYKGMYQIANEVKEIQDELKQLEEENLTIEERTVFSPLEDAEESNTNSLFQVKGIHIKEMRESIEKLLDFAGLTLSDFFNYDDAANYITHPLGDKTNWTDDVVNEEDWDNFLVKTIHIEELRHYLDLFWLETWDKNATAKTYASASVTFPGGAYTVPIAILSDEIIAGDRTDWYLKTHNVGGLFPPVYAPGYLSSIGTGTGTGYVSIVNPATNQLKIYLEIISQYFSAGEVWISTDDLLEAEIENVINKRIGEETYFSFNINTFLLLATSSNPSYLSASATASVRLVLKEINPLDSSEYQYYYIKYLASSLYPSGLTPIPTSYDITITVSQAFFQNFNRNLYNDLSLLTTYPRWEGSNIYVIGIYEVGANVSIGALSYPSPIPTRTVKSTYNIDNLKVYNLRT